MSIKSLLYWEKNLLFLVELIINGKLVDLFYFQGKIDSTVVILSYMVFQN